MSQPYPGYPSPNPGGPPKFNPDTRPLPEGWITQYDTAYNAWFYVNTRATPPKSEWKHPADLYGVPPQAFAPPGGPPPPSGGSAQSYYQGTDAASPYPQQPQQQPAYGAAPGAYSPYPAAGSPYPQQQQPQQQQYAQTPGGSGTKGPLAALGGAAAGAGLLGKLLSHGSKPHGGGGGSGSHGSPLGGLFGGGSHGGSHGGGGHGYGGGGYGGYGQQPMYGAAPKKSHGGRNAMLAGGAGLVGGALIANEFDDIGDDYREQSSYDQGYQDGNDGDWGGGGDDFGGGDF